MSRKFTVVVERDLETKWYVGEVVGLPGCHTQAPDLETLQGNIKEAIQLYLETVPVEEPLPDFVITFQVEVAA